MVNISKILRSRLARETEQNGVWHPDANLLTAFIEKTLMKQQRATVLAHLAQCRDCREYLAAASRLFETESAAVGSPAHPRARRFLPVWRWASGAAVGLVVLAVIWQFRVGLPSGTQSQKSLPAIMPPEAVSPTVSAMSQMQSESAASQIAKAKYPRLTKQFSKPTEVPAPAAPSADMAQTDKLMRFRAFERNSAAPVASSVKRSALRTQSEDRRLVHESQVEPNIVWSIDASAGSSGSRRGSVQRSLDGGKTWETVSVSAGVDFRAIAADGSDIWAGGSEGALFHSSDAGLHWTPVRVAEAGTKLRGTIVSIDARNPPRVSVTTNLGEEWISMDGGSHWGSL